MGLNVFLALVMFVFVTSFSPGPNTIMLTTSGVNFGFARTIPHMTGITLGFLTLLIASAAGLGLVFVAVPALQTVLKIAGAVYMMWLAWKVANASALPDRSAALARPLTFIEAALFQWVNPKAVVIALSAIAVFVRPDNQLADVAVVLSVFMLATALSIAAWTGFGVALRGILNSPQRARVFNVTMALLLVASIVPMVL